ncbi:MAG TPA: nitroreductase family protein [Gemmatimonadales bacterium]|nr:nitroreductase family protein [Gemmatimonadales bacterium]
MTQPDTYRHLLDLRVVRHYRSDPIPPSEVEAILQAARWTGSSKNRQDWSFIVIDDEAERRRLARAGSFTDPIRAAPVVIALVWPEAAYEFDIGRAAQSMMLAAAARDIGSCPVTLHDEDEARAALGVPADQRCRYAIAFGYPDRETEEADRERRRREGWGGRKPLSRLVHRGRFTA